MRKNKPYEMLGTPEPGTGCKILSMAEVVKIMQDPRNQEAVERINRMEGKPRMVEKILHEAHGKNTATIEFNKRQIDDQLKKEKGLSL